ncbi:MAG: endonuclease domain-containing protein [Gemmataceae bacterium]
MSRDFARSLRKNMTDAERRLWAELRRRQLLNFKFRRQAPIGAYVVDFVCVPARLIVELDGGQHNLEENKAKDEKRTTWLSSQGFHVMRFWNHDVFESLDAILEVIWSYLRKVAALQEVESPTPHPNPSPQGGRELSLAGG